MEGSGASEAMAHAGGATVHTSAGHLPAKAEQVVQYLLARNYHLTALELLVESQSSGHDGEFPELQLFFSNPDHFPPEEVARHAQTNALDLQAISREREHKLQLAEYELRLAKEDLGAMSLRLSTVSATTAAAAAATTYEAHSQPPTPSCISAAGQSAEVGAAAAADNGGTTPFLQGLVGVPEANSTVAAAAGGGLEGSGASSQQLSVAAAAAHVFTGQILDLGPGDVDWDKLGLPTNVEHAAVMSGIVAYCLHLGLRTSALTLREEAADTLPGVQLLTSTTSHLVGKLKDGGGGGAPPDGLALWRWFKLAKQAMATRAHRMEEEGGASPGGHPAGSHPAATQLQQAEQATQAMEKQLEQARAQVARLQEALDRCEAERSTARTALAKSQAQAAALRRLLDESNNLLMHSSRGSHAQQHQAPPGDVQGMVLGLLATSSVDLGWVAATTPTAGAASVAAALARSTSHKMEHAVSAAIVGQLTELLPRIMPALTIKTRLEILPMVQAVILASRDPDTQRALTGLVFNGVATPDPGQRGAVVALCVGVAAHLGPAWAAQELLASCIKQVTSPSAERRVLVAEMMAALLNPASVQLLGAPASLSPLDTPRQALQSPLVDCGTQSHALLTALHRLAEDRMEQVREAAVAALVALVKPGCLAFSRTYYATLEELLLQLVCDSDSVAGLALDSLAPALQAWCAAADLVSTSLLPRLVAELSRLSRDAAQLLNPHQAPPVAAAAAAAPTAPPSSGSQSPVVFAGSTLTYTLASGGPVAGSAAAAALKESASVPVAASSGLSMSGASVVMPAGGSSLVPRPSVGVRPGGIGGGSSVPFNAQHFACWEHQSIYHLLQLFTLLLPSLKASALQSVPPWALVAAAGEPAVLGGPGSAFTAAGAGVAHDGAAAAADGSGGRLAGPPKRSGGDAAGEEVGGDACSNGSGAGEGGAGRGAGPSPGVSLTARASSAGSSTHTFVVHGEHASGSLFASHSAMFGAAGAEGSEAGAAVAAAGDGPATAGAPGSLLAGSGLTASLGQVNLLELVHSGELDADALFGTWGGSDKAPEWKRLHWMVQFLLPELLELARVLGSPTHLSLPMTTSQDPPAPPPAGAPAGGVSVEASVQTLHKQLAKALATTATTFGAAWTQAVLVPVLCSSSACFPLALYPHGATAADATLAGAQHPHGARVGVPLQEAVEQLAPQTAGAAQVGRTCVLPHLLAAALPYASPTATADWLHVLTQVSRMPPPPSYQQVPAFFGLQHPHDVMLPPQWLMAAQRQLAAALGFAGTCNHHLVAQALQVLEGLVHSKPPASATPLPPPGAPSAFKLSGLPGAVALALAQGLLPSPDAVPGELSVPAALLLLRGTPLEVGPSFMPPPPGAAPHSMPSTPPYAPQGRGSRDGSTASGAATAAVAAPLPVMPPPEAPEALGQPSGLPALAPVSLAGAALARKVMSLLMVMLSEGDLEVQCGVVNILLDALLRYRLSTGPDDAKLVEQVCVVYDGLLASGSPALVSSVLAAAQQLAVATAPAATRSAAAAQLLEWVLQAVLVLAGQLAQPLSGPSGSPVPYPSDHQRHQAVQLLCVAHAAFMQDVRLPRLHAVLQACLNSLSGIRALLPEPYAAVLAPMLVNNRPGAAAAMAHANQAAAAMVSAMAPPQAAGVGGPTGWSAPMAAAAAVHHPAAGLIRPGGTAVTGLAGYPLQAAGAVATPLAAPHTGMFGGMGGGGSKPPAGMPPTHPGPGAGAAAAVAQSQAQSDNLSSRFEKLKKRFRKRSIADGELEPGA